MKSAAERISRLVRLTGRERRLLLRAWWQLLVVGVALRFLPVRLLLSRGTAASRRTSPLPPERVAWLLDVARRYSATRSTCLTNAFVLARILRAEGVDATVSIGVARRGGALCAHAWVEHRGRIVFGEIEGERYAPLVPVAAPRSVR